MRARFALVSTLAVSSICTLWLVDLAGAQSPVGHSAQTSESSVADTKTKGSKRAGKSSGGWHVSPAFRVDAEYDDNIFLLAANRKADVAAPSGAEAISGRYSDMKTANDVLTTLTAGLSLKGRGFKGESSLIAPEVSYELYAQNRERSNVRLGLSLEQELWADGRLRVQGRLTPNYFARNYMADAVDLDGSGSITDDERVYAPGEYRESEVGADYRLPLEKATKKHPIGAALQLGGGYYTRTFDAALAGRNLQGPTAGAKLLLDLGRRLELDLSYDYSSLRASPSDQVLLLNEADYVQDFNGNGSTTDPDVRVLTLVDRSRREHSLGASFSLGASKRLDVTLGYEHRWRQYTSNQIFDAVNRGRKDNRHQLLADVRFRVRKDLRLRLGGIYSAQNLNRTGDPAGEIDDYKRSQARLGLAYEL